MHSQTLICVHQDAGTRGHCENSGDVGMICFLGICFGRKFIGDIFEKANFMTNYISIFCWWLVNEGLHNPNLQNDTRIKSNCSSIKKIIWKHIWWVSKPVICWSLVNHSLTLSKMTVLKKLKIKLNLDLKINIHIQLWILCGIVAGINM